MIANIVKVMSRRLSLILVTFLLGIGLVVYVQKFVPTTFLGTSTVLTINENSDRSLAGDIPLFIGSSDFLGRVARKVGSDEPLAAIQRSVKVKTKGEALLIIYQSPDPQRAVTMTNAIADELPLYYHGVVSQRFEHNVAALRGSVREQRKRMAAVNARLAEVTAGDSFSGGEKPLDQVSTRLAALQQARADALAQLSADQALAQAEASRTAAITAVIRSERVAVDQTYHELQGTVARDRAALAEQQAEFTPSYPGLAGLGEKVRRESGTLRGITVEAASRPTNPSGTLSALVVANHQRSAVVAGDLARLHTLDGEIAQILSYLPAVAQRNVAIQTLLLEQTAAQQAYLAVWGRLVTALADRAQSSSLGTVIVANHALQASLTPYRSWSFIIMEILAALALALVSPFVAEKLDPRLATSDDVEGVYGFPVVAALGKS